eukprot:scaffold78573_cov36-Prasinocladus_malaysianus.AAC.3
MGQEWPPRSPELIDVPIDSDSGTHSDTSMCILLNGFPDEADHRVEHMDDPAALDRNLSMVDENY